MEDNTLNGLSILVTRPVHQADVLCNLLNKHGAKILKFPVIEIIDSKDELFFKNLADDISSYNKVIFISPNAVTKSLPKVLRHTRWPNNVKIVAIGNSTASTLLEYKQPAQIVPTTRFDTESLLSLDEMKQVTGEKIGIIRGEGGRELLGKVLTQRGARVEYIECYKRVRPKTESNYIGEHIKNNNIDIISITSAQGLHNLYEMIASKYKQYLLSTLLVVTSSRILPDVKKLGFKLTPIIAKNTSNQAILEALIEFHSANI